MTKNNKNKAKLLVIEQNFLILNHPFPLLRKEGMEEAYT